ncbi:MAG TPA: outer membrane protein [Hyphomicrobiales bacterium]|nr:outer membrane protein [Hyphomicrobiales bacterium]
MFPRVVLSSVSVIAFASAAFAADIYTPPPAPVAAYVAPPIWAGFYLGVNGGYGWSANSEPVVVNFPSETIVRRVSTFKLEPQGGFGGGQLGYNWQWGSFVFGVEADMQAAGITDRRAGPTSTFQNLDEQVSGKLDVDWFGTVRGRLGYAVGPALFYGTGGFAFGGVQYKVGYTNSSSAGFLSRDETLTGWTAGGGIEYKLSPGWSLKAEYQYLDLGNIGVSGLTPNIKCSVSPCPFNSSHDVTINTFRLGVNYHIQEYAPLK